MKHLSLHVENERATAVDLVDLCQCKYCLKDFENDMMMQKHMDDEHFKTGQEYTCRICCLAFPNSPALVMHMSRNHVRAEVIFQDFKFFPSNRRLIKLLTQTTYLF